MTAASTLKDALRIEADRLQLDCLAITTPDAIPYAAARLEQFIREGRHGSMSWLAEKADRRGSPRALWPEVRSVIMVGQSYAPATNPLDALADKDRAIISVYARGKDYHDVLKSRIRQLAQFLAKTSRADVKIFVDTAPLMEKPLAAAAGIGWQGKHTNLVSRTHGSWLFLGAILTTAELPPDAPEVDHCGSCQRCIDVCPTAAIPAPFQLDARRCLAYLSIEHKGHIPLEFRVPMGNRVFGCDDCLAVCPWNKFAAATREMRFAGKDETTNPPLVDILALSDGAFRARFAGTPVKRTGRNRVIRNALIAAANSGNADYLSAVTALLADHSSVVRAMAVWATTRLAPAAAVDKLRMQHRGREVDADVQHEWDRGQQNT